jgi:hypothetical protein
MPFPFRWPALAPRRHGNTGPVTDDRASPTRRAERERLDVKD